VDKTTIEDLGAIQQGLEAVYCRLLGNSLDSFAPLYAQDVQIYVMAVTGIPVATSEAQEFITNAAREAPWPSACQFLTEAPPTAFRATVIRQAPENWQHQHEWSSNSAAAWVAEGACVHEACFPVVDLDTYDREAVLYVLGSEGHFTLPTRYQLRRAGALQIDMDGDAAVEVPSVTPADCNKIKKLNMRFTDSDRPYRVALVWDNPSLRPSLGRSLISLLGLPVSGGFVLDPVGGAGTLALEAAHAHDAFAITSDMNPACCDAAMRNSAAIEQQSGKYVEVLRLDATSLPLRNVVDGCIGDLPYGRMCKVSHRDRLRFGQKVIGQCGKVLRPGGTCIMLCIGKQASEWFGKAAKENGMRPKRLGLAAEEKDGELVVFVGGSRALAFVYEKK
jgi:SAM-dependent methyltransferase